MRDAVKRAGHRVGLEVSRYRPYGRRRTRRLLDERVGTVVDVGANNGQFGRELREGGYTGRIVSVEPLRDAFARLRSVADDRWECLNVAAGAEPANLTLNVASNRASSSLLVMTHRHDAGLPVTTVGTQDVEVRPLDQLVQPAGPVMLKVDVQGYEREVLAGASELLRSVVLLECELSLDRLYGGQPLFAEMVGLIDSLGFDLVDLDPFFYDQADGRVLSIDALFVPRRH